MAVSLSLMKDMDLEAFIKTMKKVLSNASDDMLEALFMKVDTDCNGFVTWVSRGQADGGDSHPIVRNCSGGAGCLGAIPDPVSLLLCCLMGCKKVCDMGPCWRLSECSGKQPGWPFLPQGSPAYCGCLSGFGHWSCCYVCPMALNGPLRNRCPKSAGVF